MYEHFKLSDNPTEIKEAFSIIIPLYINFPLIISINFLILLS